MVLKYVGHIDTDPVNDETGVDIWYGDDMDVEDWEDEEEDWEDEE